MKIGPASIELRPLRDDEIELCLTLLGAALHEKKEMNALVGKIEEFVLRTILLAPLDEGDEFLRNGLAKAFSENEARKNWRHDVRQELWMIQAEWRGSADGPGTLLPHRKESKRKMGRNSRLTRTSSKLEVRNSSNDFDVWSLEKTDIKLPSLGFRTRLIGRGKIFRPYLAISLSSATELFRVLLIRAVSNGQLSRFARCAVCGKWELKARAGRRSRAKFEHLRKNPNVLQWPRFWSRLPQWPGLCASKTCRDRFSNVTLDRSAFREIDFPGIQGKGLTQYRPRGFRVGSAPNPRA
jgi:hypothetical protein